MLKNFYYQIKGKAGKDNESIFSCWAFPPIFSGKVTTKDKKEAKELIEKEYGKNFPLRVLKKDLDSNEFLLKIQEIEKGSHVERLFQERECENRECNNKYKIIDVYNDTNFRDTYGCCSEKCSKKVKEIRQEAYFTEVDFFNNAIPVIYKITNKHTNLCYIGQTIRSFTLRWWEHIVRPSNCKFHSALKESKITDWIFQVIEVIPSGNKKKLDEKESYWIRHYDSIKKGFNTVKVGNYNTDKSQKTIDEVDSSQPLDVKQEGGNGIPLTNELVGILPKRL